MDDHEDDVPQREVARTRRRDRDATAQDRALMRTGLAKTFKQILDRQARDAAGGPIRPSKEGPKR